MIGLGREGRFCFCYSCQFGSAPYPPYHELWNSVSTRILEYPPFNEVIHWDEATGAKVVLEHPEILESYILMPIFGFPTLDVFKRRIYVCLLPPDDPVSVVNRDANLRMALDIWFRFCARSCPRGGN